MPSPTPTLGPLPLQSSLHETIWGGQRLASIAGKRFPAGARIGESWETANDSVVRAGPHVGMRLDELVERYGASLIGTRAEQLHGRRFPLLAKFLDANQKLSVQAHPDDDYAAAHEGGKLGKTETWYILHADPGAQLIHGVSQSTSPQQVREAIAQNRLEDLLRHIPARAGDVVFVPAGTVHAICGGLTLYELQEYSDVTYRLYDYGRLQADGSPRELHVEKGLEVMRFEPPEDGHARPVTLDWPHVTGEGDRRALVGCRHFLMEELRLRGMVSETTTPSSCVILTALDGMCAVASQSGNVTLACGDTVVLPACLGAYTIETSNARLIRSTVPEEDDALLAQWRQAQ